MRRFKRRDLILIVVLGAELVGLSAAGLIFIGFRRGLVINVVGWSGIVLFALWRMRRDKAKPPDTTDAEATRG
jgi:hypothetical protein